MRIPFLRPLVTAVLTSVVTLNAAAQVQQMIAEPSDGSSLNYVHGFDLYDSGLFWASGGNTCGGEFASYTRIGLLGYATFPPLPAHYVMRDCVPIPADVVRDDAYVYYADNNTGRLYKKAVNAQTTDAPMEIPTPYTPLNSGFQFGAMMMWNGRLYWTDNNANQFQVNSINPDGTGANNDLTAGYGGGNHVKKLVGFTYEPSLFTFVDALFILTDDGTLFRQDVNPRAYDLITVDSGVLDFALRNESTRGGTFFSFFTSLYAAKGMNFGPCASFPSGSLVRLDAGTSGGGETVLYSASNQYQVTSVTVDDQYLFLTEQGIAGFGGNCGIWPTPANIKRQSRPSDNPGSSTTWDLIVSSGFGDPAGPNLRSDGQWLYFMNGNTINRIPTGAASIGFDFQADALEVVQASQDLNQSVPLVANKDTFARGYAHVAQNSTAKTAFFPSAVLHGFLNGVEFPDSPLSSSSAASITAQASLDTLRATPADSFLFQLPQSWVQPGSLQLTMTVNPDQSIPETGSNPLANNSVSLAAPASVTKKGRAALVLVPMRTDYPPFDPTSPGSGLNGILARTRSLLPVEDFNIYYQTEQVEKPVVNVCFCLPPVQIDMKPFYFPDDQNWALVWMAVRNALSSDPSGENDVHYVGTVSRFVSNFNGIGGARGVKLSDLVGWLPPISIPSTPFDNTTVVRFEPGPGPTPFDSPLGGVTLAHELGHNYGRFHIDQTMSALGCGGSQPAAPYQQDYPYDHCVMGPTAESAALFGFDPISQTAIPPRTADLMSYAPVTWISDFNWEAIFGQVPGAAAVAADVVGGHQPKGASTPQVLLVRGFIGPTANDATFHTFYVMGTNDVNYPKLVRDLNAASDMAAGYPYQMVCRDAGGNPLQSNNVLLFPGERAAVPQIGFVQFLPFNPLTRLVQLTYGGTVVTQRVVSPNPPVIALTSLAVDSANQNVALAWNATDADGDVLFFTIQYSADNGATWNTLKVDYVWQSITISSKMLHGSTTARLRVVASDGFNTSMATSDAFTLPNHPPVVTIQGLMPDQLVPYGSAIPLTGLALDAEDGSIPGNNLVWTLSGPTPGGGSGNSFPLTDLSPGGYAASLSATDSDQMTGTAGLRFQVLPLVVPDSTAPALDGTGSDPAYANAVQVRVPLGRQGFVYARLIHSTNDSALYAAFTGMKFGGNATVPSRVGLRVDPDFSQSSAPQTNDVGFYVGEDGLSSQLVGNGATMPPTLSPQAGFHALIARGTNGWSAELKIADALLGGWNHAVGLLLSHEAVVTAGDVYPWPVSAGASQPATWAPAYFGTPPPPANRPPVALAGPDRMVDLAQSRTIYLDGTASYDPDGDALAYQWTQLTGPAVTLSNATSAGCTFVAAPVNTQTSLGFQLTVSDGTFTSVANTTVTLQPTQRARTTFATWRTAFFSPSQLADPAVSGMMADPDGDGVVNLLEYAFNMNPLSPDRNAPVQQGSGPPAFGKILGVDPGQPAYPTITFVRWKAPVDLTYSVQSSLDLVHWTDQIASPSSFVVLSQTDVGDGSQLELVTVRPTTPMSGPAAAPEQFLRVAVTWSP